MRQAEGGGAQPIRGFARTNPSVLITDAVHFPLLRGCCRLPSSGTGVMFGLTRGRLSDGIREVILHQFAGCHEVPLLEGLAVMLPA